MPALTLPAQITIGSFFLETLTTGMYENPLHCLREYVQNSFDAIHDAVGAQLIGADDGKVTVSVTGAGAHQNISIRDNGAGASFNGLGQSGGAFGKDLELELEVRFALDDRAQHSRTLPPVRYRCQMRQPADLPGEDPHLRQGGGRSSFYLAAYLAALAAQRSARYSLILAFEKSLCLAQTIP